MGKIKKTMVLSFRTTTELAGKVKAYAVLRNLKISEAIVELVEIGLGRITK